MKIRNEEMLVVEGYPTMADVEAGECFTFKDDNELFMMLDDGEYINVADGSLIDPTRRADDERPVRLVRTELVILG